MKIDTLGAEKKPAQPRFASLASVRRELGRLYGELRLTGPGNESFYRTAGFLLQAVAAILKDEKADELEARIVALEARMEDGKP